MSLLRVARRRCKGLIPTGSGYPHSSERPKGLAHRGRRHPNPSPSPSPSPDTRSDVSKTLHPGRIGLLMRVRPSLPLSRWSRPGSEPVGIRIGIGIWVGSHRCIRCRREVRGARGLDPAFVGTRVRPGSGMGGMADLVQFAG
jgi:hypothetical protein